MKKFFDFYLKIVPPALIKLQFEGNTKYRVKPVIKYCLIKI